MQDGGWLQAFAELGETIARLWRQFWVQMGLYFGLFLVLGLPLILVILLMWFIDSTGWRPASGFYKIGQAPQVIVEATVSSGDRTGPLHT